MRFSRNQATSQIEELREAAELRDAIRRSKDEGVPCFKERISPTQEALTVIPEEVAKGAGVAIVAKDDKDIVLVAESTKSKKAAEIISELKKNGYNLKIFITTKTELSRLWERYSQAETAEKRTEVSEKVEIEKEVAEEIRNKLKTRDEAVGFFKNIQGEVPTSTLLGYILGAALALRASDIHIEQTKEKNSLIRIRIDGELRDITNFSERQTELLVNRIKLLSGLKLNIRDAAQDGRFTIENEAGVIEVRASVVPAEFGEAVVMRVLDPSIIGLELEDLGLRKDDEELIGQELKRPNGMILVTGPTGSGKTTTLYAFLKKLQSRKIKIITIEDPIEYHVEGIEQTQTDTKNNYTFASGLRSILRQDPDVILIGEIRDTETAGVSVDAALTGHLVLSTLHTNDAAGAIPRLVDLEVRPSAIGPAVALIIAQRLVRKLCPKCGRKKEISGELIDKIGKFKAGLPKKVPREIMEKGLYEAHGCLECEEGFMGRIAIMEIIKITDEMDSLIRKKATERDIKKEAAEKQGMVLMQEDGIIKALQGITTLEEVEKVTGPIEW